MTITLSRRVRRAALAVPAAALLFAGASGSASAAPTTVIGGQLTWSIVNNYGPSSAPTKNRTALGFFTRAYGPGASQGNLSGIVSPVGAAWGDTVTPDNVKGPDVVNSWTLPAVGGTYDPETNIGTVKLIGTVRWAGLSPLPVGTPSFAPFKTTVEDPTIVFDGTSTAKLFASGASSTGSAVEGTYTREQPLFTLDLSGSTNTAAADGTLSLGTLVPTLARTDVFFGSTSVGPDRDPNTWGGFSLNLVTPQSGPKGEAGANGTNGTNGTNGVDGTAGKNGTNGKNATRVIAYLRKAPWTGNKARKVSVYRNGSIVGTGSNRGKTLRVTVASGKRITSGTYTLKAGSSKKTITIG